MKNSRNYKIVASDLDGTLLGKDQRVSKENLDAIHDTVHEMAKDEARHGRAFQGLLERYFGK